MHLTNIHWVYIIFVFLMIALMIKGRDISSICIFGIFTLGLLSTHSLTQSIMGVFNSFIYAINELMGTILIISIIVAMSKVLEKTGINEAMVSPFTKLIKTPTLAYWVIGLVMMFVSWFFWPSPAIALIGAIFVPIAIRAGLPALGAAMAMNLFGHGIALSSDLVIQGAPKITADAAGIPVGDVVMASIPLVAVMGIVTTVTAFFLLKRDMKNGKLKPSLNVDFRQESKEDTPLLSATVRKALALLIPILFFIDVIVMGYAHLQGSDATALIGGTSVFILILIAFLADKEKAFEEVTSYLIEGFQFGFKVFGPVIPIAAFFYLGDSAFFQIFSSPLLEGSQGIINDLGVALAHAVPLNKEIAAITLTGVGAITGLDGSGFSGISLAGSVANLFSASIGSGTATLTALGQLAGIWVGGGTLIPWALIPCAAICGVDPFELAKRNLIPVIIGLVVTTIFAMFLI